MNLIIIGKVLKAKIEVNQKYGRFFNLIIDSDQQTTPYLFRVYEFRANAETKTQEYDPLFIKLERTNLQMDEAVCVSSYATINKFGQERYYLNDIKKITETEIDLFNEIVNFDEVPQTKGA